MNWQKNVKGKVKSGELLGSHTSFKIGGPARFFVEPKDEDDLKCLIIQLKRDKIPFLIIGAGSNLLVHDAGIKKAVIHLSASRFKRTRFYSEAVEAGAATPLASLVRAAAKKGLSGLEFLVGIPGTLGAGLVMNAGISEKAIGKAVVLRAIGDTVEWVRVMDRNGAIKIVQKKDIRFGYRHSGLSRCIVLGAKLRLKKEAVRKIQEKIKKYISYRRQSQDYSFPSAGCIFKNPAGHSAGKLIDMCGLKGAQKGGACISKKHANFILNCKNAKARDVIALMALMKRSVRQRFKITLEPEIKLWN
jgi:UDP-N-acetylmuramate dehydrogenase